MLILYLFLAIAPAWAANKSKKCLADALANTNECILNACTAYSDYEKCQSSLAAAEGRNNMKGIILKLGDSVVPFAAGSFSDALAAAKEAFKEDEIQGFAYSLKAYSGPFEVFDDSSFAAGLALADATGEVLELEVSVGSPTSAVAQTIEQYAKANGWNSKYEVTVKPADVEDLGGMIHDLLRARTERTVTVRLTAGKYKWNKQTDVPQERVLNIIGNGFKNGAKEIKAQIMMDEFLDEHIYKGFGSSYHDASHMHVNHQAAVAISGVQITDSHWSDEIVNPGPGGYHKALFNLEDSVRFTLAQSRLQVSNDVVNIIGWSYARVRFGWTYVDRYPQYPQNRENPRIITADSGWNFGGNGGVVSCTHTTPGTGVEMSANADKMTFIGC